MKELLPLLIVCLDYRTRGIAPAVLNHLGQSQKWKKTEDKENGEKQLGANASRQMKSQIFDEPPLGIVLSDNDRFARKRGERK
jgi:hypothetical protein